jgi:hypothetical protein
MSAALWAGLAAYSRQIGARSPDYLERSTGWAGIRRTADSGGATVMMDSSGRLGMKTSAISAAV